jgi:hypothetical protein
MCVRVTPAREPLLEALRAVWHPEHGVPHSIVHDLPVGLDSEGKPEQTANNHKLGMDKFLDRGWNRRSVVGAPDLWVSATLSHGNEILARLIAPPGERNKLRLGGQCEGGQGTLLRRWRDPEHSSGIGGIQAILQAKDRLVS